MRSNIAGGLVALLGLGVLVVAYGSLFTVYQTDQAIVVQFGEPVRVVTEPGLHFKWPLVQSVISVDKRILDLENSAQEVIAFDQKRLVVDAFARYRVSDPLKFYQTIGAIEGANARLSTLLNSSLRRVLGEATSIDIVRDKRAQLMAAVRTQLQAEAQSKGEQTRGEGDAERNRIYADAFGRDQDFFSFYRSMQAYETGLRSNDTRLLLRPDSDFFRYFGNPSGNVRQDAAK